MIQGLNREAWRFSGIAILLMLGTGWPKSVATAAEPGAYVRDARLSEGKRVAGWTGLFNLGASFNLSINDSVIGKLEGSNTTAGFNIETGGELNREESEWRNRMTFDETFSQTPIIRKLVKSNDVVVIDSIYLHHIPDREWIGPFVRLNLDTALFQGFEVRAAPRTYAVAKRDGDIEAIYSDHLKMTDAFSPTRTKQSFGAFVDPLKDERWDLQVRGGLGFREVFATGSLAILDEALTPEVEVKELASYFQTGPEAGISMRGKFTDKHVTYRLDAEILLPFYSRGAFREGMSALDLMYRELSLRISFKLFEWASLDYQFKIQKEPLLLDVTQLQSNVLVTFNYSLL